MAVAQAIIEQNGWVLAVRGTWGATAGAWSPGGSERSDSRWESGGVDQFPLDSDGMPKIVVRVLSEGFDRSGGQAVANAARRRTLCALKPLRRVFPQQSQLDETDHGDGTRTVRFALSDRVYSTCSVTEISFLHGWKAGQGAASLGAGLVPNNSARACPLPIVRAAVPQFRLVRGTSFVHMDWVVATHHPESFGVELHQPLAAVKVVATDGTNMVTTWLTGLQTSPLYADGLRCVGGRVNLAGLTAGVVTLVATFYPWIGPARTIGSGHVASVAAPLSTSAEEPVVICYDPDGTRYAVRHVVVDAASGSDVTLNVTVGGSLAGAKAGTPAISVSRALMALYNANITLAPGNGQAGGARSCDFCVITLAPGIQSWGGTGVTTGFGAREGYLVVQGDPDDPDGRGNCIFRSGATANPQLRNTRWWFRDLTIEGGQQVFLSSPMVHTDNVHVRGKPGFEAATQSVFLSTASSLQYGQTHTNLTWGETGLGLFGASQRAGLLRNVRTTRGVAGSTLIGIERIQGAVYPDMRDTFLSFASQITDQIAWNCSGKSLQGKGFFWSVSSGDGVFSSPGIHMRLAMVNCLMERSGTNEENFFSIGESAYAQFQDSVFEGNSFIGQRVNLHNDSPVPAADLAHHNNASRNNYWDRQGTKHDVFGTNGALTGSWEWLRRGPSRQRACAAHRWRGGIEFPACPYRFAGGHRYRLCGPWEQCLAAVCR